jgi:large subunit ribosomal protein L27
MAHKKGEGSTQNGRDSISKRLGVKLYGGQTAQPGSILVRQRGTRYLMGDNVYMGKDHTLHSYILGKVSFTKGKNDKVSIHVKPFEAAEPVSAKVEKVAAKATAAPKAAAKATTKVAAAAPVVAAAVMEAPKVADVVEMDIDAAFDEPVVATVVAGADDLKKIEGIGPKIAQLLNEDGILTFAQLAATDVERVKAILEAAGSRYKMHDPTTWGQQAQLAADGKWDELKKWQDELNGGK